MAAKKAAKTEEAVVKKSKCPITNEQFDEKVKPLMIQIGDKKDVASPREFASGSRGWYFGDKVVVEIDGVPCRCQVTCSITVIGSKPELEE